MVQGILHDRNMLTDEELVYDSEGNLVATNCTLTGA